MAECSEAERAYLDELLLDNRPSNESQLEHFRAAVATERSEADVWCDRVLMVVSEVPQEIRTSRYFRERLVRVVAAEVAISTIESRI